jgi:hypothetical protein
MMKFALLTTVAILFPVAYFSQTTQSNPFAGTWKLNVAQSTFNPGPGPKSETVVIPASEGKVEVRDMDNDGKEVTWSYPSSFSSSAGTAVPIDGIEGATVTERIANRTVDHKWKFPDRTESGHGVLSKDGKVMKYTLVGKTEDGKKIHTVLIFEKQ